MNKVIIINGSGTSGKDTVVEMVKANFGRYKNIYNVSSIDMIRKAAKILGWTGSKNEKDREFLHNMKMLASEYNDHSMCYMLSQLATFEDPFIGFFHIREPEEIAAFKNIIYNTPTPVVTILVQRDCIKKFDNYADSNVGNFQYDYIIENNGTKYDLECKVVKLFSKFIWN